MINPELGTPHHHPTITPPSPLTTPGGEKLADIHRWEGGGSWEQVQPAAPSGAKISQLDKSFTDSSFLLTDLDTVTLWPPQPGPAWN